MSVRSEPSSKAFAIAPKTNEHKPQQKPRNSRKSGRSSTNLNHLTLAPLSSNKPVLSDDEDPSTPADAHWRSTSYIAGKSAPTTPGILSRSASTQRMASHSYTHLAFADDNNDAYYYSAAAGPGTGTATATATAGLGLEKSKSTSILLHHHHHHHSAKAKKAQHKPRRSAGSSVRLIGAQTDDGEWLFRAGTAIAAGARESKGQSWLATRASSTSLVAQDPDDSGLVRRRSSLDEERAAASARGSRAASRVPSRVPSRAPSARTSRRGSRSDHGGSKVDLAFYSPLASRTALARGVGGGNGQEYFAAGAEELEYAGPDFVNEEEEEEEDEEEAEEREAEKLDEEEIARLARERGFGLGGLVDQLLGSTLFSVREDGEDTDEEEAGTGVQSAGRAEGGGDGGRRVRQESERVMAKSQAPRQMVEGDGQGGGWSDAAWLLSVATKVMF